MNGDYRSATPAAEVSVQTGSRLHCGLFSDERPQGRRFQGFGLMVDRPGFHVVGRRSEDGQHRISLNGLRASNSEAVGSEIIAKGLTYLDRLHEAVESPTFLEIEINRVIQPHTGLGSGTQLAYAIATVWNELNGSPLTAQEIRQTLQRGKRSCIGSFGFYRGGLLIDAGMAQDETQGACRFAAILPSEWRFILATPTGVQGVAGSAELEAFRNLPTLPIEQTERLTVLLDDLQDAVEDYSRFSSILREFGLIVGESFSAVQGGRFSHPACDLLFETMSELGIEGIAQSSWGPTMFGVCESSEQAEVVSERLKQALPAEKFEVNTVAPLNRGAALTFSPAEESPL